MKIGKFDLNPLDVLLVFVPIAVILGLTHQSPVWVFITSGIAIVPLAGLMGKATEHLSERVGPGLGGLLNASFGNAAELIIAGLALKKGLYDVVKASITGSIIGNVLLVLGLAVLVGGMRFKRQTFNRVAAGHSSATMALSAVGLLVPAMFHFVAPAEHRGEVNLSLWVAMILFATYGLGLVFSLRTHSYLFGGHPDDQGALGTDTWSMKRSIITLLLATACVGVVAEFLVGAVEHTARAWGMTEVFVGVVLVAIIGNAAEHSTAVIIASKNKVTDLALNIAVGSGIQMALFVAPVLVFISYGLGGPPLDLVFSPFEVLSITISVAILSLICLDGETHWMEGVQLLAVYLILGVAFFFLPG